MADLRLCNEFAFRIPLSFLERFGMALDRLPVTFLSANVRGARHQFDSRITNMCILACPHRVENLRGVQETCLFPQDPPDTVPSNP